MSDKKNAIPDEEIGTAEKRKQDHITLSVKSRSSISELNSRFYYEPMLSGFPTQKDEPIDFLGKQLSHPIWISSMTGGSELAQVINRNLAKLAGEFGLGMGLGSCRNLLYSDEFLKDFDLRYLIGDQPFYANLGIAQIAYLIDNGEINRIVELVNKLQADGLIIHVNPIQEYMQAEGDKIIEAPLLTITKLLDKIDLKIIVKEVGQGMGYESLKALLTLPIEAIDFAAFGGTNFAKLEHLRNSDSKTFDPICFVGHTAEEMLTMVHDIMDLHPNDILCKQLIISGGVQDYLEGYYLIGKSRIPAIYGQAGAFLKHAKGDYQELKGFVEKEIAGLKMAKSYLSIK